MEQSGCVTVAKSRRRHRGSPSEDEEPSSLEDYDTRRALWLRWGWAHFGSPCAAAWPSTYSAYLAPASPLGTSALSSAFFLTKRTFISRTVVLPLT